MARETIAGEVRAELGRQNLSQTYVCARLKWTQPYLSRRLTGQVAFSTDDLEKIAEFLDVPVIRFLEPAA
jgi:transcriptional regulator with XRE-family HTH domain